MAIRDLLLYGVPLGLIILGGVRAAQEKLKLSEEAARWVRAGLAGGAALLVMNAEAIQAAWPPFQTIVVQGGVVLGTILSVAGYWPDVQKVGRRIVGR
jgi:hypothetical protein